jgi:hypothetical protein
MPRKSRKSTFKDWDALLKAVKLHETDLGGITPFQEAMEKAYAAAQASQVVQNARRAYAKEATRRLRVHLEAGADAASYLRSFIKSVLGPRSEMLFRFGMKPRLSRRPSSPRRKQAVGFELPD